jgi:hypothetical protein
VGNTYLLSYTIFTTYSDIVKVVNCDWILTMNKAIWSTSDQAHNQSNKQVSKQFNKPIHIYIFLLSNYKRKKQTFLFFFILKKGYSHEIKFIQYI